VPRAGLDKDPRDVAAMFDKVARRYDLTNTVLSFGQDHWWRRCTRVAVAAGSGERVLDVAAGTAVSTVELARAGAWCVAADFSLGMLRAGRQAGRHRDGASDGSPVEAPGLAAVSDSRRGCWRYLKGYQLRVPLVGADALALPFADGAFDAVTISFGLRNVADPDAALTELARVTKPGGRLVVCEFSTPRWRAFRTVYLEYLMGALPAVARRVSSNPEAYVYLAESIQAWPDQRVLAQRIADAGWGDVEWRDLTGGIVALHRAVKPVALRSTSSS
jgi:demethylmenaquinone methyltransferase/2-methoxy-6-polyprenyl-1,4-benzoquinol methylase